MTTKKPTQKKHNIFIELPAVLYENCNIRDIGHNSHNVIMVKKIYGISFHIDNITSIMSLKDVYNTDFYLATDNKYNSSYTFEQLHNHLCTNDCSVINVLGSQYVIYEKLKKMLGINNCIVEMPKVNYNDKKIKEAKTEIERKINEKRKQEELEDIYYRKHMYDYSYDTLNNMSLKEYDDHIKFKGVEPQFKGFDPPKFKTFID